MPPLWADDSRRTENWDVRFGTQNFVSLILCQATAMAAAFLATALASRVFGPAGYGKFVAAVTVSQLAGALALNWSLPSLARFGCEEFVRNGTITDSFWSRTLLFSASLALTLAFSPYWLPPLTKALGLSENWILPIVAVTGSSNIWLHFQSALQGAKQPTQQAALLLLERVLNLIFVCGIFAFPNPNPILLIVSAVVSSLIPSGVAFLSLQYLIGPPHIPPRTTVMRLFSFSLPLVPYSLVAFFSTQYLDTFFITHYLSHLDLGLFSIASLALGAVLQIPTIAGTLISPLMVTLHAQDRTEAIPRFIRNVLPPLAWATTVSLCFFVFLAMHLLPLLFGPRYTNAIPLLWPLLAAGSCAVPVLLGLGAASNALSLTYISAVAATITAILKALLNFHVLPQFGLAGLAWATAGAQLGGLLAWFALFSRQIPGCTSWVLLVPIPVILGATVAPLAGDGFGFAVALTGAAVLGAWQFEDLNSTAKLLNQYISPALSQIISSKGRRWH